MEGGSDARRKPRRRRKKATAMQCDGEEVEVLVEGCSSAAVATGAAGAADLAPPLASRVAPVSSARQTFAGG